MTTLLWCLFGAALLIILTKAPVAVAQQKAGGYDNAHPRDQQARLTGWGRRALAAHQNQLESFPIFAAGALVASFAAVDQSTAGTLGLVYIAARIAYVICYLMNIHILRSIVWAIGIIASLALICSPAWAALA